MIETVESFGEETVASGSIRTGESADIARLLLFRTSLPGG
jgi:hypothetical protein